MKVNSFENYKDQYLKSVNSPEQFWASVAENFTWKKKWETVLEYDWSTPKFEWFKGGELNITENCIDRHLENKGNQNAIIWEPNNPKDKNRIYTYNQLHTEVCRFANVLKNNGVKKGDRVCIYMPMVPELAFAVLACARIGAIHSVVFAGFSSQALASRINDAECKVLLTSDGANRGAKQLDLKSIVNEALELTPSIEKTIVLNHIGLDIFMKEGRDVRWSDELTKVNDICSAETMDAEDTLFILYTSGSTGKPKGMVHTCGGYMVYAAYSFQNVFQYQEKDVFFCTADIGWITGHSYIVYGPLLSGATTLMFEGVPSFPDYGRFWEIVEKHKVNQFYTAPTAIRSLACQPEELVKKHDLSSLKVLGTVGEPINEEAWHWYDDKIGENNTPIVDTWWQTETGGIMISPLAGITKTIPTFATLPLPGIQPCLMDSNKQEINAKAGEGSLCIKHPWPSMARTIYGDHKRYKETYFSGYENMYFTGDGALRDEGGNYRVTGRMDDVVIVSGHNLGTAPIENSINEHENVSECAVVGIPHDIKGNALFGFIVIDKVAESRGVLFSEVNALIRNSIGPIAKLEDIQIVEGLPKTRSGKIMRRILRKIASGNFTNLGDISTLVNPEIVSEIIKSVKN